MKGEKLLEREFVVAKQRREEREGESLSGMKANDQRG